MSCAHRIGLKRALLTVLGTGFAILPAMVLFVPQEVSGTEDLMRGLPAWERYKCAICHNNPTIQPGNSDLNAFGRDFEENGKIWDRALALLNSDGDRCTNGSEIGDRDGDGDFDDGGPRPRENSNPGDPADCVAPIDPATWGRIKNIFSNELKQYMYVEPEYEYLKQYFGP